MTEITNFITKENRMIVQILHEDLYVEAYVDKNEWTGIWACTIMVNGLHQDAMNSEDELAVFPFEYKDFFIQISVLQNGYFMYSIRK